MKKNSILLAAFTLFVLMLVLVSCNNGEIVENKNEIKEEARDTIDNIGNSEGEKNKPDEIKHSDVENIVLLCDDSFSFSNNFGTDSGFYYLTEEKEIGDEIFGKHLMYIDYATKREVYLCSDSGCRHDKESCNAVFLAYEFGMDSVVFVYNNKLYVLSRDFDYDGAETIDMLWSGGDNIITDIESNTVALYQMEIDGSNRKKYFEFPKNTIVEKLVFGSENNLWFVTKELKVEQDGNKSYTYSSNRMLVKLNLESKRFDKSISLDFENGIRYDVVGGSGNNFVLKGVEYPEGYDQDSIRKLSDDEWIKMFKSSSTICSVLNCKDNTVKELYRVENAYKIVNIKVKDGFMFVPDYSNGDVIKINLESGEKVILASIGNYYFQGCYKDALCFSSDDGDVYFIDINNGEVSNCKLKNMSLGWELLFMADTNDKMLVIYDYDADYIGDGAYEINRYKYGLILKSDLYNSIENYEPIEMVGRGK